MRIHFVYAGDLQTNPVSSPYCITHNLYNYLQSKVDEVLYYQWTDKTEIDLQPDDIVLGHPHYDPETVIQRAFRGKPCRAKILIHPLHTTRQSDNLPFDPLVKLADAVLSITGPYWYDTIQNTPFAHWKPKITRLDMAVDPDLWPYQKLTWNEPGHRRVAYVGSSTPNKNLGLLYAIASRLPEVDFLWYGGSSDHQLAHLPNVQVTGWVEFNQDLVAKICSEADLLISTSSSDACPTTLLEFGLASGLVPICTSQSGYYNQESFINIPLEAEVATDVVRQWVEKPTTELQQLSQFNRQVCLKHYSWDKFNQTVWQVVQEYL